MDMYYKNSFQNKDIFGSTFHKNFLCQTLKSVILLGA